MAKRMGLELDIELHPAPGGEGEPQISGSIAVVLGGERYGMTLQPMSNDNAQAAVEALAIEVKKLVRGEEHGLGGPVPDWWPHEHELAQRLVDEDTAEFEPDDHEHPLAGDSACCGAPMTVGGDGGEGTLYGVCTKCQRPADGVAPVP